MHTAQINRKNIDRGKKESAREKKTKIYTKKCTEHTHNRLEEPMRASRVNDTSIESGKRIMLSQG